MSYIKQFLEWFNIVLRDEIENYLTDIKLWDLLFLDL